MNSSGAICAWCNVYCVLCVCLAYIAVEQHVVEHISIDSADNRSFSLLEKLLLFAFGWFFYVRVSCVSHLVTVATCGYCLFLLVFFHSTLYWLLHCAHSDEFKMGLSAVAFWFKLSYRFLFLSIAIRSVQWLCGFYFSIQFVSACVCFMYSIPYSVEYLLLTSLSHCLLASEHTHIEKCQLSLWVAHFHYWNRFVQFSLHQYTLTIRVELFYHMLNWSIEMFYVYIGCGNDCTNEWMNKKKTTIHEPKIKLLATTCSEKRTSNECHGEHIELKNELNQNRWAKPPIHCERARAKEEERSHGRVWASGEFNYCQTRTNSNKTGTR